MLTYSQLPYRSKKVTKDLKALNKLAMWPVGELTDRNEDVHVSNWHRTEEKGCC